MSSVRPAGRPIIRMWPKILLFDFLSRYKYDNDQTWHNDSTYSALTMYTTVSDLDFTSISQQCQTLLTEYFILGSD